MRVRAEWRERERRNREVRGRAEPFLHPDISVTTKRLDDFGDAAVEDQLATLATLRERGADNGVTELALLGVAITLLIAIVVPNTGVTEFGEASDLWELLARIVASVIIALMIVVMTVVGARDWIRRDRRRELAAVWLAAYEDELTRRAQLRGNDRNHRVGFRRRRVELEQPRTVR